jgi:hypothetical protein
MNNRIIASVASSLFLCLAVSGPVHGQGSGDKAFKARLNGYQTAPQTFSTTGTGDFLGRLAHGELEYELAYQDLEAPVIFAHIHFGRPGLSGGIMVWLCDNTGNGPAGTPACPPASGGHVKGTLTAADVVGPESQGIEPGAFDEFIKALRRRAGYVNVHSDKFPSGEIRGNIR